MYPKPTKPIIELQSHIITGVARSNPTASKQLWVCFVSESIEYKDFNDSRVVGFLLL